MDRFNELAMNYSDETADEFAAAAGQDRRGRRLEPRHHHRLRDGRAALPAGRRRRHHALGRRAPPRRALPPAAQRRPTCCSSTSPPTTSTPSRSAWLERYLADYKGAVVAVTHDRYFLDNVAGWILELDRGRGIPYEGNYSSWLEQKEKRLEMQERRDLAKERIIAELEWVRKNPKGRQTKQKARMQQLRGAGRRGEEHQARRRPDPHPGGHPPGQRGRAGRGPAQGLRRQAADRGPRVRPAARRHRRRHRPQRRRQDHAVQDDHRPGAARRGHAAHRRHRADLPTSTRAATRWTPRRPSGRRSPAAGADQGRRARDELARLHLGLQLQEGRPAEEGRDALRR